MWNLIAIYTQNINCFLNIQRPLFSVVICYNVNMQDYQLKFNSRNIYYAHTTDYNNTKLSYYKHSHFRYELYIFLQGRCNFCIEASNFELKSYNVVLIQPGHHHHLMLHKDTDNYERIVINFDKNVILPELFEFLTSETEFFGLNEDDVFFRLLNEFESSANTFNEVDTTLLLKLTLNKLLLYLKQSKSISSVPTNQALIKLISYINTNIFLPLDIKLISEALFFSPTYISSLIVRHLGVSLMDYVKQKKILLARNMLQSGLRPTLVAEKLSFKTYSTFYRLYIKYTKNKPEEDFKRLHHNQSKPQQ